MGGSAESKAYKWLVASNVLICADNSYSHRPDEPEVVVLKSYYVHSHYRQWRKVGGHQAQACRPSSSLPSRNGRISGHQSTKQNRNRRPRQPAALCGLNRSLPGLLTVTTRLQPETEPEQTANGHAALCGPICSAPGSVTVTTRLQPEIEQEQTANGHAALCGLKLLNFQDQ